MRAAVHHVLASVALPWAATPSPSPSTSTGPNPDTVSPGLLGFLSFLFLIVAVYFIGRGLTKQLKRVSFDEDAATAAMLGKASAPADGVDLGQGTDLGQGIDLGTESGAGPDDAVPTP